MDVIENLKQEHKIIERELIELETIMDSEELNLSNLIHVFKLLCAFWDKHEEKEEKIFSVFEREQIKIPVEKMLCDHGEMKGHKKNMQRAICSGSEFEIKNALNNSGRIIIEKLREHMNYEDEVLYTLSLEIFTPEELEEMNNFID